MLLNMLNICNKYYNYIPLIYFFIILQIGRSHDIASNCMSFKRNQITKTSAWFTCLHHLVLLIGWTKKYDPINA